MRERRQFDHGDIDKLIERLKDGDKAAFRELVIRLQNPVYNLAYKILWNREDAEDVLQETFIRVLEKIGDFREESHLATWIYKIATNTALMKLRERRRKENKFSPLDNFDEVEVIPSQLAVAPKNPFDELLASESHEILEKAIARLPETYRGAFVLKDIEQLPTEDVAYILGIGQEALYSRLKRARMFLREAVLQAYREQKESEHAVPR